MKSALQDWVMELTLMQQSVLMSAIRGPDCIAKQHKCKSIIRWYRRCVLLSAFDCSPINNPYHKGGGSFTGPSYQTRSSPNWEDDIKGCTDDFLDSRDELPFHYFMHFMHAVEILGYKHPDLRIRKWWNEFYMRICKALHLSPESVCQMEKRLGDNQLDWISCSDESLTCSD